MSKSVRVCEHVGKPETHFGEGSRIIGQKTGYMEDSRQCNEQHQQQ